MGIVDHQCRTNRPDQAEARVLGAMVFDDLGLRAGSERLNR